MKRINLSMGNREYLMIYASIIEMKVRDEDYLGGRRFDFTPRQLSRRECGHHFYEAGL